MALADLIILHRASAAAPVADELLRDACTIDTCLRVVRAASLPAAEQPSAERAIAAGLERYSGAEAYRFLLQLACGLESEMAGETEILGQIKESWRQFETTQPERAAALRPFMQRLLQDTKEIRSEYVVGLGSASYGALVRRLLGADDGTTLLLGAGQLAEAVLPYLEDRDVLIWNRGTERARALVERQRPADARRMQVVNGEAEELQAWHRAHNAVVCIPADPVRDPARVQAWLERGARGRLLHLGIQEAAGTAWERVEGLITLRDLFQLRDAHAEQRAALLARARRACATKAQLAKLDDADGSRPGSASHGWEDLAVLQAFGY